MSTKPLLLYGPLLSLYIYISHKSYYTIQNTIIHVPATLNPLYGIAIIVYM